MQTWKLNNNKWRHNDIITKNNGKIRTSVKPNKLYVIRKVLIRAIQNVLSIEFVPLWKSYGHFGQILAFLRFPLTKYGRATWPKKQISKIFILS